MLDHNEHVGTPKFKRHKEDFICQHCHKFNKGNGYTNHCSNCLYSLHVDLFPGDRRADCGGIMKPIAIVTKNKKQKVLQVCQKCQHQFMCRLADNDNMSSIAKIINDSIGLL